jgi:hypothetical protein
MSASRQQDWHTVREEFSDRPDTAQVTRVTFPLLAAATLAGVLRYERPNGTQEAHPPKSRDLVREPKKEGSTR